MKKKRKVMICLEKRPGRAAHGSLHRIVSLLDEAHGALVVARMASAAPRLECYEEIGEAINLVESAIIWGIRKQQANQPERKA